MFCSKYAKTVNFFARLVATFEVCYSPLQTIKTQIRPNKMLDLIWIQTNWLSDSIYEKLFEGVNFENKNQMTKKHAKLPSMQRVKTV